MATQKFALLVNSPLTDRMTTPVGANISSQYTDKDKGKPVKIVAGDKCEPCADGNAIDGFMESSNQLTQTINGGYYPAGIVRNHRAIVENGAGQVQLAVNDIVVAYTQTAIGTPGYAQVKKLVTGTFADLAAVATFLGNYWGKPVWRVISIVSGNGSAGDEVMIERVW